MFHWRIRTQVGIINNHLIAGGIGGTGEKRWDYFQKVVAAPGLKKTGLAFNFAGMKTGEVWIALITVLTSLVGNACVSTTSAYSLSSYVSVAAAQSCSSRACIAAQTLHMRCCFVACCCKMFCTSDCNANHFRCSAAYLCPMLVVMHLRHLH